MKKIISMLLIVSMLFMCSCSLSKKQETTETEPESQSEIENESETESVTQTEPVSESEPEVSSEEKLKKENNVYIDLARRYFDGKENAYVQINSTVKYKSGAKIVSVYAKAKNGNIFSISSPVKGTDNDGNSYEGVYTLENYEVGDISYLHISLKSGDEIKEDTWYKTKSAGIDESGKESVEFDPNEFAEYLDAEDVSVKKEGDTYIVTFTSYDVVSKALNDIGDIFEATDFMGEDETDIDISSVFNLEENENEIETTEILERTVCSCYINSNTKLIEKITVSNDESDTEMTFDWDYENMSVPQEATDADEITGEEFVNNLVGTMFAIALSAIS